MSVATSPDPAAILKSRNYIPLLIIAALLGIPISVFAYFFLYAITRLQTILYTTIPGHVSSHMFTTWWPVVPLTLGGLIVGVIVTKLPGRGGEAPIGGFQTGGGTPKPSYLWSIGLAAIVSIGFGAVIGPEGPIIALGGGLAYVLATAVVKQLPQQAGRLIAASGSFAAISTLLGSPLSGAFLLLEASDMGGLLMEVALLPGILAAGVGYLIFVGLDSLTGFGLFNLTIPNLPPFGSPTFGQILWAVCIGLAAPILVYAIKYTAARWNELLQKQVVLFTALGGLLTGLLAVVFASVTGHNSMYILFSGQNQLPEFVRNAATFSTGALLLILLLKSVAYAVALVSFRGGPTFPAIFLGAVIGALIAHVFGLVLIAGLAIGIGAMTAAMLRLPLTAILLSTLLLGADGIRVMPLSIIAVVIAYVFGSRMSTVQVSDHAT